jgi:hypothetical protein
MSGLLKEIWLPEIKQQFYASAKFLDASTDYTPFVDNNTINLAQTGIDPNVYKNYTKRPFPKMTRADLPISLVVDTYDTDTISVPSAEQVQLAYNKLQSVIKQINLKLVEKVSIDAAYGFSPKQANTANNQLVVTTTGSARTDASGFKQFTINDLISIATLFDNMLAPAEGRVLVLNPTHFQELAAQEALLFKNFANVKTGEPIDLYGMKIYKFAKTPYFNKSTLVRREQGTAAAPSTDAISSFAYLESEVFRAEGTHNMSYLPASMNPDGRSDDIGVEFRYSVGTIRSKAQIAIVSGVSS